MFENNANSLIALCSEPVHTALPLYSTLLLPLVYSTPPSPLLYSFPLLCSRIHQPTSQWQKPPAGAPSNQTRYPLPCTIQEQQLTTKGVFTSLIESLGVKDAQFEELISLDADTIRSLR
jgi:hypothetical protein